MPGKLARLLDRDDKIFDIALRDLEKATRHKSVDVKLIGDVTRLGHKIIKELGYDSKDITAYELYRILRVHVDELGRDTDYVGVMIDNNCISFNVDDIKYDKKHKVEFKSRSLVNMRQALQYELVSRYSGVTSVKNSVINTAIRDISLTK